MILNIFCYIPTLVQTPIVIREQLRETDAENRQALGRTQGILLKRGSIIGARGAKGTTRKPTESTNLAS